MTTISSNSSQDIAAEIVKKGGNLTSPPENVKESKEKVDAKTPEEN